MPVVPTTAYSQAEDALNLARALMNDTAGTVFTDTLLMPLLNSAYRGLQRELAENGVSVLIEQQDIDLELDTTTGTTNTEISDVSSPQLPSDCLMPHMLWERATPNTADVFVPMEKFMSGGSMLNLQASIVSATLGVARGQDQPDRRNASDHSPRSIRKGATRADVGHRSDSDSVVHRSAGVCYGGSGGAFAGRTGARTGSAWDRPDGNRKPY